MGVLPLAMLAPMSASACWTILEGEAVAGTEEFFCEGVASAEVHLFGEDAQRGLAGDEVNFDDARVGVEGAQHLGGKDRAAGAGDGQDEAEFGAWGAGRTWLQRSRE